MRSKRGIFRRRSYLVDRPFQFSIIFSVLGFLVLTTVITCMLHFVPTMDVEGLDGVEVRNLVIRTNVTCICVSWIVVGLLLLSVSHRVAGPAGVLKRAILGMAEGDFDHRTWIRRNDYLQDLALATEVLSKHLQQEAAAREQFILALRKRLFLEDLGGAHEVIDAYIQDTSVEPMYSKTDSDVPAISTETRAPEVVVH